MLETLWLTSTPFNRRGAPNRYWIGVGILPPHVQETVERRDAYADTLIAGAGAAFVI